MRVLHVHSGNLYGGVEVLLGTIARCSKLCPEMDAEFALCFEGKIATELRKAGATVHILGEVHARNRRQVIRTRQTLSNILSLRQFDAAICHMIWPLALFGVVVRRIKLPLVFWMHDAVTRRSWLSLWAQLVSPDLVICNSHFTALSLKRIFRRVPSETFYYPVMSRAETLNPWQRHKVRSSLITASEAVVILQASRMEPWKGHNVLLEALAEIIDLPQWVCWIAGSPQRRREAVYEQSLRQRVKELGLSHRVRFLEHRSDITQLMQAADIYCQPNVGAEPFGIAFVEAMKAGLPVVTSAAGGPLEIIDKSCGVLVEPKSTASLALHLKALIENEQQRRRLGAAGAHRASALCDPGRQLRRLDAILRRTASSRSAAQEH